MSSEISNRVEKLDMQFYGLSLRERLLIVIAGLAFILLFGFVTFIEPAIKESERVAKQVQSRQDAVSDLEQQISQLQKAIQKDPDLPLRQRISSVKGKIADLDANLDGYTEDLVPANKMPELLEKVLSRSDKLTLLSMESIAPVQLLNAQDAETSGNNINLYQHGVRLVLQGAYFDIQKYLAQIETLQWRFYWKVFSYDVQQHPVAQVELELYTLSTNAAFIGVKNND